MTPVESIAELLHDRMGFDSSVVVSSANRRWIDERCTATGCASLRDYAQLLGRSPEERAILVELIVIPETFFFRYPESFDALLDRARQHPGKQLRILSLACSTGEEVYSIAMKLLEAGFFAGQFLVEGRDISEKAIATAKRGAYHRNSFRTENPAWRTICFQEDEGKWTVNPGIRQAVRFESGNLLELEDENSWDVIFCRNVLIYFSETTRGDAIRRISRALTPDGILFLGPAERAVFLEMGWAPAQYPMSFACVRKEEASERKFSAPPLPPLPSLPKPKPRQTPARQIAPPVVAIPEKAAPVSSIDQARQLADSGQFGEARELLQKIVRETPFSAEGHFLRGLVEEAAGREDIAEDCYRRSLYIDPSHTSAMQHLALLLSRQGRSQAARNFKRRANFSTDKP